MENYSDTSGMSMNELEAIHFIDENLHPDFTLEQLDFLEDWIYTNNEYILENNDSNCIAVINSRNLESFIKLIALLKKRQELKEKEKLHEQPKQSIFEKIFGRVKAFRVKKPHQKRYD